MNVKHPARQEQGLGAPSQPQSSGTEFYTRNGSLAAREAQMSGEQQAKEQAIAQQAAQAGLQQGQLAATNAMTDKLVRERAILEQSSALGQPVAPEQVEVGQLTDRLMQGVSPEQLIQEGRHPEFVRAAIGNFQAIQAQSEQQFIADQQAQGMGQVPGY